MLRNWYIEEIGPHHCDASRTAASKNVGMPSPPHQGFLRVGEEQLLPIDAKTRQSSPDLRTTEPIDELFTKRFLHMGVASRVDDHHGVLIEQARIASNQNLETRYHRTTD